MAARLETLPDAELLSATQRDPAAFGVFYMRHASAMLRFFARRTVMGARFPLRRLMRVRDRVVADIDYLRARGIRVGLIEIDVERNRVVVQLHRSRSGARRLISRRYGPAVLIRPRDVT